ncbi:MAG: thiol reductant ABC exporter subunit CydC [Desulfitobacterium sp.]|nr:thiol reductant ABC exporter subunit CydC [Desulfitobacterium sp.]
MKNTWWLIKELTPLWRRAALALLLSALTVSSHIGLMATSSYLLARAALQPHIMELTLTIVGVRFFGISRAVFRYFERLISHDVTFRILSRLRVMIYEGIEPIGSSLRSFRSGDLLSRIIGDVESLQNLFLKVLLPPLVAIVVLLGYGVFLGKYDQGFAYILAGAFLAIGLLLPWVVRLLGRNVGAMRVKGKGALHTAILDALQGMTEILAFSQTKKVLEGVTKAQEQLSASDRKNAKITGFTNALVGVISNLGMLAVVAWGVLLVQEGRLDGIYLGMLALGVLSSFEAVAPLPTSQHYVEETQVAGERLHTLIQKGQEIREEEEEKKKNYYLQEIPPINGQVEFKRVSFRYNQDEPWVLEELSFSIPQGKKVGIVGKSGVGKSTLVNLLLGFAKQEKGDIYLDGFNIAEIPPERLREFFNVVSKKSHLFHATIRENLLVAKIDGTDEELSASAKIAQIHEDIINLPQGYDTLIGESGMLLSGGQQQRLAIARMLLKDAPIVIFDEATSGLDPLLEKELIQRCLERLKDKTVLIIAHHLETLRELDEILVLDHGRLAERGTHEDLLQQNGVYKALWEEASLEIGGFTQSTFNS